MSEMHEMKVKDFLLKVGDYNRIRLNVYLPDKEDVQEVVDFKQRFCDVMTFDGKMSDELREKVESLMDCTVEFIDNVIMDDEVVPTICLDITKE